VRALVSTVQFMQRPQLDAELVIKARYKRGLTAAELARRAGLSKTFICDVEHGRRGGSPETQKAIAEALDMPLADLWIKEAA